MREKLQPAGQGNRVNILAENSFAEPGRKRIQPAGVFVPVHSGYCAFYKGQTHKRQYKQIQLKGQGLALHVNPVAAGPDLDPQQKEQADDGDIASGKVHPVSRNGIADGAEHSYTGCVDQKGDQVQQLKGAFHQAQEEKGIDNQPAEEAGIPKQRKTDGWNRRNLSRRMVYKLNNGDNRQIKQKENKHCNQMKVQFMPRIHPRIKAAADDTGIQEQKKNCVEK